MCDKRGSTFIAVQHLSIDPKGRHRHDLRLTDKVIEVGIRAGHISSALADQKHNAAQAEYNRLAALVSPEAPEIPRWNYVCRRYAEVHGHLDFFWQPCWHLRWCGCHAFQIVVSQTRLADDVTRHRADWNCIRVILGMGEIDCNVAGTFHFNHSHSFRARVVAHSVTAGSIQGQQPVELGLGGSAA